MREETARSFFDYAPEHQIIPIELAEATELSGSMQLLNYPTYLIGARFDRESKVDAYEILDAATLTLIGLGAEIDPKPWLRPLRWAWGRNLFPTCVGIWEPASSSPVFVIREANGIWCPRLQVREANGRLVCYFKGRFAVVGGSFTVHNRAGVRIGEIESPTGEGSYQFLMRDGRELGTIVQQTPPPDIHSPWADSYLVTVKEPQAGQLAASLLLLSAAFAMDLVFRDRA